MKRITSIAAVLLLSAVLAHNARAMSWDIDTVDSGFWVGRGPSIAVDDSGNAYLSYDNVMTNTVKYAYKNSGGSVWTSSVVDSGWNGMTSLALDSNNAPHISYGSVYASLSGSGWDIQPTGAGGYRTSLAIDKNDMPHISANGLTYEAYNGSSWDVINFSNGGIISSLALDSNGNSHISYFDMTQHVSHDSLEYAAFDGSGWIHETIDPSFHTHTSFDDALAVDSLGVPHVVYYEQDDQTLFYASRTSSGWDIEDLGNFGAVNVSLKMDKNNNPVIAYVGGDMPNSVSGLYYMTNDGTGWNRQLVTNMATADYDGSISLALDSNGDPFIAYQGMDQRNMMVAYGQSEPAAPPVPEPATMALFGIGSAAMAFLRKKK